MAAGFVLFEHPFILKMQSKIARVKQKKDKTRLVLLRTVAEPDNPEGGDRGRITWRNGDLALTRVYKAQGTIWHEGDVNGQPPETGLECLLEIDPVRRLHNSVYHTFSHLLTGVARLLLRREFSGNSKVLDGRGFVAMHGQGENIGRADEIWSAAEELLGRDVPVEFRVMNRADALPLIGGFYNEYIPKKAETVRIVRVGEDTPWIPCGGVHIENLMQIKAAELAEKPKNKDGSLVLTYRLDY